MIKDESFISNLKYDLPAGLVVFLVALPLCLGIALASGAPLFAGIIAGIAGGIVVGSLSGSSLSVSGPAAGLTVIVLNAIDVLDTYEVFLSAVVLAGIFQVILGYLKAGIIGHFFPVSVIKGMLAAIGLILILKQIPHAFGYDADPEGDQSFIQPDGENTFTELAQALNYSSTGAIIISVVSLIILILWARPVLKKYTFFTLVPAPLVVVLFGVLMNWVFSQWMPELMLTGEHLVSLPVASDLQGFIGQFTFPDFSRLLDKQVIIAAITIAIIASLESLLSLDATDKLDPMKRIAPPSRELKAQGVGNIVSGLIGGIPVTAVIVRSSANVGSNAKSKTSAIFHGFLLIFTVAFIPELLNLIPLSALAAILLMVGYKLTSPSLYKGIFAKGMDQFAPFIITILAILLTDLLIGILIGLVVGLFFVMKTNFHQAYIVTQDDKNFLIILTKDVSFLNKASLRRKLEEIPPESYVIIDGTRSKFIDHDISETIEDFQETAIFRNITVEIKKTASSSNSKFKLDTT
ncbi:MAG: SulP family inorganic anion transporter [Cyclobacteriaceae bacterium]